MKRRLLLPKEVGYYSSSLQHFMHDFDEFIDFLGPAGRVDPTDATDYLISTAGLNLRNLEYDSHKDYILQDNRPILWACIVCASMAVSRDGVVKVCYLGFDNGVRKLTLNGMKAMERKPNEERL